MSQDDEGTTFHFGFVFIVVLWMERVDGKRSEKLKFDFTFGLGKNRESAVRKKLGMHSQLKIGCCLFKLYHSSLLLSLSNLSFSSTFVLLFVEWVRSGLKTTEV